MRNKKLTIAAVLTSLTILGFACAQFYRSIYADEWKNEATIVQNVYGSLEVTADRVDTFYGEETFKIIRGKNNLGVQVIVWMSKNGVHQENALDGVDEQKIRQLVLARHPQTDVLRIMPAVFGGRYAWEAFYREPVNGREGHFYDYYAFSDGAYLDTYRLGLK